MEIRAGKRWRTREERLRIVEETLKPDVSVAQVGQAHGINANQIFHWRRQYREGWFGNEASQALIRVKVAGAKPAKRSAENLHAKQKQGKRAEAIESGTIEIDLGHARVRIAGAADPDCVRAALEGLAR